LDEAGVDWRRNLNPQTDFADLLQTALSLQLPQPIKDAAAASAKNFGGDALRAAETERDTKQRERIARYRQRLVDGPVLAIPLREARFQFNPNNIQPLDTLGTVYPDMRIVDVWGILTVSGGALMNPTFSKVQVSAPASLSARPVEGDGWTLELNPGWDIAPGERRGDYIVKKNQ
jgi:hypothetical protein